MELRSSAFGDGGAIPAAHSCEGEDVSPPLEWSGVPPEAVSLLVTCDDPDAPGGMFRHWATWGIAPAATGLARGAAGPRSGRNDFGRKGWAGPCPPRGKGAHRYRFRVVALSAPLDLPDGTGCAEAEQAAGPLMLAEAVLVGRFAR